MSVVNLDGTSYLRFPTNDDFYPQESISVDFDLTLPDWNQPFSSQIIGNFNNQGYGIFYQNSLEEILDFSILDCGNNQIFAFNQEGRLQTQRNFPTQNNPLDIIAQTTDQFGNKIYYDNGNNKVFIFNSINILEREFVINGEVFDVRTINVDNEGNIFILNVAEQTILKYSPQGVFIQNENLEEPFHTNFTINREGDIKSFMSNKYTPMLVDCDDSVYNIWGVNIYKNNNPWFFPGDNAQTFGIDLQDNLWVIYNNNMLVKLTKNGRVLFNKQFHNITPCETETCETSISSSSIGFTRELDRDGYRDFTWVLLSESNYALKLDVDANIVECVLVTNSLDTERFSDTRFENVKLYTNGEFTSFTDKKKFGINCNNLNGSKVVAKIAIADVCDGLISVRTLSHDVSNLNGTHSIKFSYNGLDGEGKLFIDGDLKDSFLAEGIIMYNESRPPTLIGADSGRFRALKEELGIEEPVFLIGQIDQVELSKNTETFRANIINNSTTKLEFPGPNKISFQERVDKFFLFRPNGFVSPSFNVNIINSGFEDVEDQSIINSEIMEIIDGNKLVQNELKSLNWKKEIRLRDLTGLVVEPESPSHSDTPPDFLPSDLPTSD